MEETKENIEPEALVDGVEEVGANQQGFIQELMGVQPASNHEGFTKQLIGREKLSLTKSIKSAHAGVCSALNKTSTRIRSVRRRVWIGIMFGFIAVLFLFGLTAQYIFPNHPDIVAFAEDNVKDIINIFRFFENNAYLIFQSLSTLAIYAVVLFLVLSFLRLFAKGSQRRKTIITLLTSFIKYVGAIAMLVVVLVIWGVNLTTLLGGVGILALIIGFGAQSLVADILAGVFMVFENSIQVDDIVTIDGFRGVVTDIGIRTTKMQNPEGDVKVINNSQIRSIVNMSQHASLAKCYFTIGYGENLAKVEELISQNMEEIALELPNAIGELAYKGVVEFNERGVQLRVDARCLEVNRVPLVREMNRQIKLLLDKNGIKLAMPQLELTEAKKQTATRKK
jgi:small conductance mechanosensitive channel